MALNEIDYKLDWQFTNSIEKIRKDLDAIEKMGATHVLIEANVSFDVAELGIVIN